MQFITEVEVADEHGNVEIVEVMTELPRHIAEKATAIYAQSGGRKSHNEVVAEAKASVS